VTPLESADRGSATPLTVLDHPRHVAVAVPEEQPDHHARDESAGRTEHEVPGRAGRDVRNPGKRVRLGWVPSYRMTSGWSTLVVASSAVIQAWSCAQARVEDCLEPTDTLIVSGGLGHEDAAADARLLRHLRRLAAQARRVASV